MRRIAFRPSRAQRGRKHGDARAEMEEFAPGSIHDALQAARITQLNTRAIPAHIESRSSLPGLTRQSIFFARRWMRGSSPAHDADRIGSIRAEFVAVRICGGFLSGG